MSRILVYDPSRATAESIGLLVSTQVDVGVDAAAAITDARELIARNDYVAVIVDARPVGLRDESAECLTLIHDLAEHRQRFLLVHCSAWAKEPGIAARVRATAGEFSLIEVDKRAENWPTYLLKVVKAHIEARRIVADVHQLFGGNPISYDGLRWHPSATEAIRTIKQSIEENWRNICDPVSKNEIMRWFWVTDAAGDIPSVSLM